MTDIIAKHHDKQRAANYTASVISIAGSATAIVAVCLASGPLGWISLGVGVIGVSISGGNFLANR